MDDYEREMGVPLNIYPHRKIIFSNRDDNGEETEYDVNELVNTNNSNIKDLSHLFVVGDNFFLVSASKTASTFFMKIDSQFTFPVKKKLNVKKHAFINIKYVHQLFKNYKNKPLTVCFSDTFQAERTLAKLSLCRKSTAKDYWDVIGHVFGYGINYKTPGEANRFYPFDDDIRKNEISEYFEEFYHQKIDKIKGYYDEERKETNYDKTFELILKWLNQRGLSDTLYKQYMQAFFRKLEEGKSIGIQDFDPFAFFYPPIKKAIRKYRSSTETSSDENESDEEEEEDDDDNDDGDDEDNHDDEDNDDDEDDDDNDDGDDERCQP